MRRAVADVLDGAARRHERLPDNLAAEYALPTGLRAAAAKQIHLERLEVEDGQQILDRGGHGRFRSQRLRRILDAPLSRSMTIVIFLSWRHLCSHRLKGPRM